MRHSATERATEGATPARGRAFGVPRRRRALTTTLGVLLAALLLAHALFVETFTVPSASMEPSYQPGDRILVVKHLGAVKRGDVIVFSGADVFYQSQPREGLRGAVDTVAGWLGFRPDDQDYLKRVIGVGGDHVVVGKDGKLRVNDRVVSEPYLPRGQRRASDQPFDIRVPHGSVFVLGDNRDNSDDSRSHLGDPGGGSVPLDKIVGRVTATYWSAR